MELYKKGMPASLIASRFKVSETTIYQILKKYHTPLRGRKVYTERTVKQIVSLYRKKQSGCYIGHKLHISPSSVYRLLEKHGVARMDARVFIIAKRELHRLYFMKKLNQRQIAERYPGITHGQVSRMMKRYGMITRKTARENHPGWKGGRIVTPDGHVYVKDAQHPRTHCNGYVPEHLLVMEKKLKRPISENEIIHHIDINPSNNSPGNLYLLKGRKEHSATHKSLYTCLKGLNIVRKMLDRGQIKFESGKYIIGEQQ